MARYFTLAEAERLIPRVDRAIREALVLKAEFQEGDEILRESARKVMMQGGMTIDRDHLLEVRQKRDNAATRLQAALEFIQDQGCLVKDLDVGLLDFPTLYHGREVYLCWRLGEERIEFWHEIEAGFRGRQPIDADFVANHTGEN